MNKIDIIPGTIEFTTEVDNTERPDIYEEHASLVALSPDPELVPSRHTSGSTFKNGLIFFNQNGFYYIQHEAYYYNNGNGNGLVENFNPHSINPVTKWKVVFQSRTDIKIYKDDSLIYENASFDFPSDQVYIYSYMSSSTGELRYTKNDYVKVVDGGNTIFNEDFDTIDNNVWKEFSKGTVYDGTQIPEFPTIAAPVVAVLGLMFMMRRRK